MIEIKLKPNEICVLEVGERYTIFKRGTEYQPYVVAYSYDPRSGSWAAGHYFDTLKAASHFFYQNDPMYEEDTILDAKEFAARVMDTGTEVEPNEYETMSWQQVEPDETVWTIYAHIDEYGDIVHSKDDAEYTLTANMKLTEEQSEALMNGDLDVVEESVIRDEIYPEYVRIMKKEVLA